MVQMQATKMPLAIYIDFSRFGFKKIEEETSPQSFFRYPEVRLGPV